MKHLSTIFFLFICAFLMSYCTKKKEITETAPPKTDTLYGVVGEGTSMHLLQLCQKSPADTLIFAINDSTILTNVALLIGNPIEVVYKKMDNENVALQITGNETYGVAIGQWTMPDPIAPEKVMGIDLEINGEASSIRMATLLFKSWQLTGKKDTILLTGESIGNGQSFMFTDTAVIKQHDDKLTLTLLGTNTIFTKQSY